MMKIKISDIVILKNSRTELKITELQASIDNHGLLQPVLVRKADQDKNYVLIAGERRLRACKKLGWSEIECSLSFLPDDQDGVLQLVENIQREDLSIYEQSRVVTELKKKYGVSDSKLAEIIGKYPMWIVRRIRYYKVWKYLENQPFVKKTEIENMTLKVGSTIGDYNESDWLKLFYAVGSKQWSDIELNKKCREVTGMQKIHNRRSRHGSVEEKIVEDVEAANVIEKIDDFKTRILPKANEIRIYMTKRNTFLKMREIVRQLGGEEL